MKSIFKAIGWTILNFILQFAVMLPFSIAYVASGITDDAILNQKISENTFLFTIISNTVIIAIAFLASKIKKKKVIEEWKLFTRSPKNYILPCIIAFTYSLFFFLITYDPITNSKSMIHICAESYNSFALPMMALALLISAPFAEEIINRGVIMNTLKRSFSVRVSIIISAVIFGLIHIPAGGIVLGTGAAIMGVVLAIIYEKTNSLWVAIAAHMVANLPDFIFYSSPEINDALRISIALLSLAVSATLLIIWLKPQKK